MHSSFRVSSQVSHDNHVRIGHRLEELLQDRLPEPAPIPGPPAPAHDDMRDAVLVAEGVDNAHDVAAPEGHRRAVKLLSQRHGVRDAPLRPGSC